MNKDPNLKDVAKKCRKAWTTEVGDLMFILDKVSPADTAKIRSSMVKVLG